MKNAVYGAPMLGDVPADAIQVSPLVPGAAALERIADGDLDAIAVAAPPGAIERRYVLAQALRTLKPGGALAAAAPKDKGGLRLRKELEAFGCAVTEQSAKHQRLCACIRPDAPSGLAEAIAAGAPQTPAQLSLRSQPGLFTWDRPDPGSMLLATHLRGLSGVGADFGCGVGLLALAVLASPKVTSLLLVDIDRRAIEAARMNVTDPRAAFLQADLLNTPISPAKGAQVLAGKPALFEKNPGSAPARGKAENKGLDFVVMNPPFHDGGAEDRSLGQAFIQRAAKELRQGGTLKLVANVGLPYEAPLRERFADVRLLEQSGGYKVYDARRR